MPPVKKIVNTWVTELGVCLTGCESVDIFSFWSAFSQRSQITQTQAQSDVQVPSYLSVSHIIIMLIAILHSIQIQRISSTQQFSHFQWQWITLLRLIWPYREIETETQRGRQTDSQRACLCVVKEYGVHEHGQINLHSKITLCNREDAKIQWQINSTKLELGEMQYVTPSQWSKAGRVGFICRLWCVCVWVCVCVVWEGEQAEHIKWGHPGLSFESMHLQQDWQSLIGKIHHSFGHCSKLWSDKL